MAENNEAESDIERLIKAELNFIVFKKKPIANDYLVYATSLEDEKALIRQYISQDKVKKWVLIQCSIADSVYKDFALKAKFDANENKCEVVRQSLDYFIKNLWIHRGKLLSESIKEQVTYSLRNFIEENKLEAKIHSDEKTTRIEKLKNLGRDIYDLIEKIYPSKSILCIDGVEDL